MKMKKRSLEERTQDSEGVAWSGFAGGAERSAWGRYGKEGRDGNGPHPGHSRFSCLLRILSLHGLFLIQCNREGNTMVPKWV